LKNSKIYLLVIAVLITACGLLSIYSSSYQKEGALGKIIFERQLLWAALGIALFMSISHFHYRRLWDLTYFIYACMLALLLLVLVLGIVRLGAQRWLKFAGFNFQPSELSKLFILIFLARYFSGKSAGNIYGQSEKMGIWRALVLPFIFVAIPMSLIIEQPDLGSGIMILLIFIAIVYLAGVRQKYIVLLLLVMGLSIPVFWHFLRDYQKERVMVFLNPNIDPLGAGYTVIQSKIAIGSGGILGKGWLAGTQSQLRFLPESHTDFIFATFTEEWGFLGSSVLLVLYYLIIRQGLEIAKRTTDSFGRLLALGISLMLGMQILINVAMNMGMAPIVGLPLPLMSYGGSSIIVTYAALAILSNIDQNRAIF